ncbi:hypothetical protein C1645_764061 [Glomus cerebriforme]|uniref:DUF1764-domain-containing protein n=1 Tax=Glomus cerebriforme TaxID=658196 RepID=A0A397T4M9_9GLOM|nr:hypothetical protein C1645_764061 [Glomus cerebriforme]
MSSTKPKTDNKKSKVEKKEYSTSIKNKNNKKSTTNDNDKNKKVIENSKSEIDNIFASAKSKKVSTDSQPQELSSSTASSSSSTIKQKVEEFVFKVPAIPDKSQSAKRKLELNDDNGFSDSRGTKSRKTTEDGLPIFDIKELNIGNGGDTPLCPFDCDCCECSFRLPSVYNNVHGIKF